MRSCHGSLALDAALDSPPNSPALTISQAKDAKRAAAKEKAAAKSSSKF